MSDQGDVHIIREQLKHAEATGNKQRAKGLKKVLKDRESYESGKSQRVRPHVRTSHENFHRSRSYHTAGAKPPWTGGTTMVVGDRKRARKQRWEGRWHQTKDKAGDARHKASRTADKHHNNIHRYGGVAVAGAGVGLMTAGGVYANRAIKKELAKPVHKQVGKDHEKNLRKVRRGTTVFGAGLGMSYTSAQLSVLGTGGHMAGGFGLASGAAVAATQAYDNHKSMQPNKSNQKMWTVYTRTRNGQIERVRRRNPNYGKGKRK